jgi:hypothetical protein
MIGCDKSHQRLGTVRLHREVRVQRWIVMRKGKGNEAPHLLFDNPELDIECFVKLHKSIDVVIDLIKAVFHAGESFPHLFHNLYVTRMK